MANHRIAPELRERAIMHLMPPYNWTLRQVADDIGVGTATVHGWRKQLELEGLIIRKVEPGAEQGSLAAANQNVAEYDLPKSHCSRALPCHIPLSIRLLTLKWSNRPSKP